MSSRVTFAVASGFLATSLFGVFAQQRQPSEPPPTFRSGINYVEFPVRVTDRQGNFVRGLGQADFKVYEDGWEQEISTFNMVDVPPPDPRQPLVEPAGGNVPFVLREGDTIDGRVYLFVLDDYHVRPQYTFRVKSIVESFVRKRMGPKDIGAVVYTSVVRGQDFTRDRRALVASLDRFMGSLDTDEPGDTQDLKSASTLQKIRSMAETLGRIRGRHKALVFISPTLGCTVQKGAIGEYDQFDLNTALLDTPNRRCYASLWEAVRTTTQANVSIYAFDPTNIGNPGWVSPSIDGRGGPGAALQRARAADGNPVSVFDGMRVLAEETGGFTVTNVNNFDKALDRIVREHSVYYLIGYYSTNDKADGKTRRNSVTLNRTDVQVVYRPTYIGPN